MLSVIDIARELSVSRTQVYSWIASGELPAVDLGGADRVRPSYRVRREDLDRFLSLRSTTKPRPQTRRRKPARTTKQYF